jgi:hypothetical protein
VKKNQLEKCREFLCESRHPVDVYLIKIIALLCNQLLRQLRDNPFAASGASDIWNIFMNVLSDFPIID